MGAPVVISGTWYKLADISLVEPAIFTRMIWAALIGFVLFSEIPDVWTWIGGAVIVVGTTYIPAAKPCVG